MKSSKFVISLTSLSVICLISVSIASAQIKIGYVNSNKVLETYKEAQDVRKQLQEINGQWEEEARNMQKTMRELQEQLESQSLLLSEERRAEKQQEIQTKYLEYQKFLNDKWGNQGEAIKKEAELLKPVIDKINEAIKKLGEEEGFDYIFDTVAANILYASDSQPDLTDKLLVELNKGLPGGTSTASTKPNSND